MATTMVCPDCGSAEFHRRDTAVIETALVFTEHGWMPTGETIIDAERDGDIICDDCEVEVEDADLVDEDTYNESEAD